MSRTSRPGVAQGLREQEPGLGTDGGPERVGVSRIDEGGLDPEAGQGVGEEVVAAAVERPRGDDVIARAAQRRHREVHGGLPARGGDGSHPAFQGGDAFFEHRVGGIGDARVDVPRALRVEERGGLIGVAEHVRRGLVDGGGASAGRGIGLLPRVQHQGVELEVVRRRHVQSSWVAKAAAPAARRHHRGRRPGAGRAGSVYGAAAPGRSGSPIFGSFGRQDAVEAGRAERETMKS